MTTKKTSRSRSKSVKTIKQKVSSATKKKKATEAVSTLKNKETKKDLKKGKKVSEPRQKGRGDQEAKRDNDLEQDTTKEKEKIKRPRGRPRKVQPSSSEKLNPIESNENTCKAPTEPSEKQEKPTKREKKYKLKKEASKMKVKESSISEEEEEELLHDRDKARSNSTNKRKKAVSEKDDEDDSKSDSEAKDNVKLSSTPKLGTSKNTKSGRGSQKIKKNLKKSESLESTADTLIDEEPKRKKAGDKIPQDEKMDVEKEALDEDEDEAEDEAPEAEDEASETEDQREDIKEKKKSRKGRRKKSEKNEETDTIEGESSRKKEKRVTKKSANQLKITEKIKGAKSSKKIKKSAEKDNNKRSEEGSDRSDNSEENLVDDTPKKANKSSTKSEFSNLDVKVDEHSYLKHSCKVHIKGKTIYDKKLIQKNIKKNNGKLLRSLQCPDIYYVYDRGGRIGEAGKDNTSKPLTEAQAIQEFEKRLNEMSAKGDYIIQEINYTRDESAQKQAELKASVSKSKLHPAVASLLSVLFDLSMMNKQLSEMGYDTKKLAVTKLTAKNIDDGYEILNSISEIMKKKASKSKLEELTSLFYSAIPHENEYIIIDTDQRVKEKLELLDSLKEIQIAFKLCEKQNEVNAVDNNYKKLKCEIDYIEPQSREYEIIEEYITNTQEFYNFKIIDLFSLSREGEDQRFKLWKARGNRMLLCYGSRLTNFVGILSQGLKIPSLEAPSSMYRVGKGVYLTDMVSKAHNHCFSYASGGEFCILLCDAVLGEQHELLHDNLNMHEEVPREKHSVLAHGHKAPPRSSYTEIESGLKVPKGKPENTLFQDLAEETTDNRYRVRSVDYIESLDDRKIRKKLEEIERDLLYTWNKIRDPNVFDFIYFFIRLIDKDQTQVAPESLQYLSEVLVNALDKLINAVNSETRKDNRNAETLDDMCNSLKMIVFLMLYFLHVTCVKKAKNSLKDELNELSAKDKNAPSKKNPKKKISSKDLSKDTVVMLLKQHADCLSVLRTVLTLNLRFLWQKKQIDDEFYRYFLDLALKMLESRQLLKDYKPSKEDIFSILELTLADNSGALKNAELKLINLIYEEELLVEPISDFIIKAYRSSQVNISKLATDTLSMLVSYILERTNVNAESQAVKNTRDFLCRVAQHIPRAFNTNLSLFICLYESEAYLLRNALTDILTEIIKQVLTPKEGEEIDLDNEEKHKKAKIRLLDKLVKRTTDKHAYSRSHLLKALVDLCSSNVVPKQYLQILLLKGCERIKDVSANVRKKALELLDKVIRMYYSIFVGNSDSGFMSVPELQRQTKFNTEETKNLERDVKALQEKLKDHLEESDEYSEIQSEIKIHQRKLESIKNNQDNIGEYINMLESLEKILPNLLQLLGSKNLGDVTETIKLFVTLKLFKVSFAEAGIKKMLVLIWSKEKTVLEELLKAYWKLYFDPKAFSSEQIAWNLINLYTAANLTEKTSLEELILTVLDVAHDEKDQKLREDYTFHGPVFKILWNIFLAGFHKMEKEIAIEDQEGPSKDKISTRNALTLLRVANVRKKEILESRFDSFNVILNSFLKNNNPDWIFLKEISHMVEKSKEASPRVNQMIKSMLLLMIKWHGTVNNEWFCAAEQVTNMIFALKQNPEILVQYFIVQCSRFMLADGHSRRGASNLRSPNIEPPISPMNMNNREGDSHGFLGNTQKLEEDLSRIDNGMSNDQTNYNYEEKFCQLIFLVGHVSVKFLLHFDIIENQFKKLKNEAETKMQADQKDNDAENELEKIGGGVEADFEHKISILHNISESCIVFKNLLAAYVPYMKAIIMEMINKKGSTRNPVVERAVVLSVCKYMCTSNEFCQENLNLLFALLKCKIDPITKTNIIIALGDLIHRYPNTTEPYTPNLYKNLQDENANVRKTTLLVITHLILNDMLKLKAEISDIALLFEDPDQRIQNLVKLFFHELHKKDSKTIYNLLPEAIGRLSRMEKVDEAVFQNFAKNVMQYLEKEKYSESLVEKLCARFSNTENEKEWRNTAFCLHLLSYNEKGLRKLIDMFDFYRDKLNDPTINEYFHAILVKMKKFNKPEVKTLLEEWESKLSNNTVEEGGEERKRKIPENKRKPSKKTKLRGKSTQEMISEDADDSDNQSRVSSRKPSQKVVNSQRSLENSNSLPLREKKDRAAKQKERRRNIVYEDDDDEGDFIVPDEEFDMIEEAA